MRWGSFSLDGSMVDSSSESQVLQSGHLPIQRCWVAPQFRQMKTLRTLAMLQVIEPVGGREGTVVTTASWSRERGAS